jgi:hypothetical protein
VDTSSTPTSPETGSLDTNQAAEAFNAMFDPPKEEKAPVEAKPDAVMPAEKPAEPNAQGEGDDAPLSEAEGNEIVTVLVDGKPVELTKAQIAEAHKSGLRQADYTKKTQEVSEQRKTADAEIARAREERNQYSQGLAKAQAVLESQLQEQSNIDWQKLLDSDPVEYLKQQHLAQSRQAQLKQTYEQKQHLDAQAQAEHQQALKAHVESQRSELVAKIPEWKDEAKMKAGATELREYLKTQGLSEQEIYSVTDHRAIVQSYKAMKYDQIIANAKAATKKIATTPQRVERASNGTFSPLDKSSAAVQRFNKSGSVDDAASVFASMFS